MRKATMQRLVLWCIVLSGCLVVPFSASAKAPPLPTVKLDSYYKWLRHYTPPVASRSKIPNHKYYVATVSGTFSYYAAIDYRKPPQGGIVCGKPRSSAQHRGSLGGNGPVDADAEFLFARPETAKQCAEMPLPVHWLAFQLNDGTGWHHPNILGTPLAVPASNHTYSYAVIGHGQKAQFRLLDTYTPDNYGLLEIQLRPAVSSDCSSYPAFGFASLNACMSAL